MKKYILVMFLILTFVVIAYSANVKNYFKQPGKDGDNVLYIKGTMDASNATSISMNSISVSTITATNRITGGTLTDGTASITGGAGSGFTTISVSTATITNTASVKVIDFAVNLDTTTVPSSTGIVGLTSGFKMYVSTGTSAGNWELIGSQS